jgi:hypothetical protein
MLAHCELVLTIINKMHFAIHLTLVIHAIYLNKYMHNTITYNSKLGHNI